MTTRIAIGDAWEKLKQIRSESINCCVTSPAYWMLRHYRSGPQEMGREPTIRQYLDKLLQVIDEIHRVLMPNGTFWLNIGDTYSTQSGKARGVVYPEHGKIRNPVRGALIKSKEVLNKSLCFVPERVALAMLDRGWICRNKNIWHKPNAMPDGVKDRFSVDYEPVYFWTKLPRYYFKPQRRPNGTGNMRCVWRINTANSRDTLTAAFPEELVEACIEAGCPPGGTVLDPFLGSGTVAVVAERLGRTCYGIELNRECAERAMTRIRSARITNGN